MDRLDVRVKGSEASLANLKSGSIRALVDLDSAVPGLNFFRITGKDLQVPPGIAITKIRPSDLHLTVEAASERAFAVNPVISGSVPEKIAVKVLPKLVRVRALDDDLDRVKSVVTDPVRIVELVEKRKIDVSVSVRPKGIHVEGIHPDRVTVILEAPAP
jgi:hypothetical protein